MAFLRAQTNIVASLKSIDWLLLVGSYVLVGAGLVTMHSFTGDSPFFERQLLWVLLSTVVLGLTAAIDARVFRRTSILVLLFGATAALLALLLVIGEPVLGAKNRFDLGFFALQPADPAQLVLVLILAKYFSKRHVEIAQLKHVFISGMYAFAFFVLLFLQPDFGSAVIVFSIWLGMVLVSGIPLKRLALIATLCMVAVGGLWVFAFQDYQKERILTFLNPLGDIQGAGYNAYQSTIAVGSGQILGRGIGYGTQSKLEFLPEFETDFIFAAFAEEWGFAGVTILFALFGVVFWRLLVAARFGASNFETLFCLGVLIWFLSHAVIHIGMNIGLLPVTGTTIPYLSYGGSHLMTEFLALGIVLSMNRYARSVRREEADREIEGLTS